MTELLQGKEKNCQCAKGLLQPQGPLRSDPSLKGTHLPAGHSLMERRPREGHSNWHNISAALSPHIGFLLGSWKAYLEQTLLS